MYDKSLRVLKKTLGGASIESVFDELQIVKRNLRKILKRNILQYIHMYEYIYSYILKKRLGMLSSGLIK